MGIVQRSITHITDTLAVRSIFLHLPGNWIVRSLDERDYGIDLQLEIFDGNKPTGRIAYVQVKGTEKSFKRKPKITDFPVRTVEYAKLFDAPFFVFYNSIFDNETYFVWLQKYASTRLKQDLPNWQSKKTTTIKFPKSNTLKKNLEKISDILIRHELRRAGISFLLNYEWLVMHLEALKSGGLISVEPIIQSSENIIALDEKFFEKYAIAIDDLSIESLVECLGKWDVVKGFSDDDLIEIDRQMNNLFLVKMAFLDEDEMDEFSVGNASEDAHPY